MTPRTWHAAYTARAATDLSRVTDRLTYTANIGKNSQHLMHSMQPEIVVKLHYIITVISMISDFIQNMCKLAA